MEAELRVSLAKEITPERGGDRKKKSVIMPLISCPRYVCERVTLSIIMILLLVSTKTSKKIACDNCSCCKLLLNLQQSAIVFLHTMIQMASLPRCLPYTILD